MFTVKKTTPYTDAQLMGIYDVLVEEGAQKAKLQAAYEDASYEYRVNNEYLYDLAEKYGLDETRLMDQIAYDLDMLEAEGLYYDHL